MAGVFLLSALLLRVGGWPPPGGESTPTCTSTRIWLAALALIGALVLLYPRRTAWLLVPAALGLAWARTGPPPAAVPGSLLRAQPRAVVIQARVRWAQAGAATGCSFEVDQVEGIHPKIRVWVRSSLPAAPQSGARIQITARTRMQGGRLSLEQAIWRPSGGPNSPPGFLHRLRSWVRTRLQAQLPSDDAGLARALLLGESQAAPWLQRSAYRQLGLLHLLCISGLHFWVWGGLLRRVLPGRCAILRWPCLIALAGLAQFSAPVLRAATALALREWFAARGRACLAWQLWACALWLELCRSDGLPMGLLLSYAATAGLLWVPLPRDGNLFKRSLVPSAAAFLATAPLLHTWQATVEVWSIPLTPIFALLLPFRMIASVLSCAPWCGELGALMFSVSRVFEQCCLHLFAAMPGTPWPLPHISSMNILLTCFVGLVCLRLRPKLACSGLLALGLGNLLIGSTQLAPQPAARLVITEAPSRWLIATGPNGSVLLPLDPSLLASTRRLERDLLPALAQARARPP